MKIPDLKRLLLCFFLTVFVSFVVSEKLELEERDERSSGEGQPKPKNLVPLKHRRYKSYRDNTTIQQTRKSVSPQSTEEIPHIILPHPDTIKSPRHSPAFELQKSPPDLQFGLAFTVPFVSLSTEKLLHTVQGKGYDPYHNGVSSLLKLNFGGLLLAGVVGVIGVLALVLPGLLHGGGAGGGWGNGVLDNLINHSFTESLYNDYENGWGGKGGIPVGHVNGWGKSEFAGGGERDGRRIGSGVGKLVGMLRRSLSFASENFSKCLVKKVCEKGNKGHDRVVKILEGVKDSEIWKESDLFSEVRKVVGGDFSGCGGVAGVDCGGVDKIESVVMEIFGDEVL